MARLLTDKGLVTEYGTRFATRSNKGRTGVSPTIGFEFEIPLHVHNIVEEGILEDECEVYDSDYWHEDPLEGGYGAIMSRAWLSKRGFHTHMECGGQEVCSPIHTNIEQARATARALIESANNCWWLAPDEPPNDNQFCGIHVHAGNRLDYDANRCFTSFLYAIMNRTSSERFVWELSGREKGWEYANQAEAECWDTAGYDGYLDHNAMVQENGTDGMYTSEYRLFVGMSDYLIPAIDFAHSFTKWARPIWDRSGVRREYLFNERWGDWSHAVPYIADYKKWLNKQPGYAALKGVQALSHI